MKGGVPLEALFAGRPGRLPPLPVQEPTPPTASTASATIHAVEPRGWTNPNAQERVIKSPDPHRIARTLGVSVSSSRPVRRPGPSMPSGWLPVSRLRPRSFTTRPKARSRSARLNGSLPIRRLKGDGSSRSGLAASWAARLPLSAPVPPDWAPQSSCDAGATRCASMTATTGSAAC